VADASEREQRQYALMRQRVQDLRQGRSYIGAVIGDLEALVWQLQEVPEAWRDRFVEVWSVLELDYALALDKGTRLPTAQDGDIAEALDGLDALLDERQRP
jgi:hypothetical protein